MVHDCPDCVRISGVQRRPAQLPWLLVWLDRGQDSARRDTHALPSGPGAQRPRRLPSPADDASAPACACASATPGCRVYGDADHRQDSGFGSITAVTVLMVGRFASTESEETRAS